MRTPKPLDLKLRPSRYLASYFLLVHSMAAWVLLLILPSLLAVIGLVTVFYSLGHYWRRFVMFTDSRAVAQLKFADNRWQVLRSGAQRFEGMQWRDATILPYMVVLQLSDCNGRSLNIAILADQIDFSSFRRLRVIAGFASMTRRHWFDFW